MVQVVDWSAFRRRVVRVMERKYGKLIAGSLFVTAIVVIGEAIAILAGEEFVYRLLRWLVLVALPAVASIPVGYFGLAFFLLLGALMFVALVETSPIVTKWLETRHANAATMPPTDLQAQSKPATPVSQAEQDIVHKLRVVWNQAGAKAAEKLGYLYLSVGIYLEDRGPWFNELLPKREYLESAMRAVEETLKDREHTGLTQALTVFNRFWLVYTDTAKWIERIQKHTDYSPLTADPTSRGYLPRFQEANREFRKRLNELNEWNEYKGKLYHLVPDGGAHELLASTQPEVRP